MGIEISSPAFSAGADIPKQYTCDGEDLSPPLSWSGVPDGTESLVLIVDDPDAPARTWVHWVIYDLPGDLPGLEEGASNVGAEGKNDFGRQGYGGPCPPRGPAHRYFFKIYALDTKIGLPSGVIKAKIEQAMVGHILDKGELIGRYARQAAR